MMAKEKMKILLEIATEIISRVHSNLCREKQIEKAQELSEINRQLIVFSDRLKTTTVMDAKAFVEHRRKKENHQ